MADDLFAKPFEKDNKKKKQKKQARARVRCPYCWEALKLTENDDADQVVLSHGRKCWWLEKNGKGHAVIAERGLKVDVEESKK